MVFIQQICLAHIEISVGDYDKNIISRYLDISTTVNKIMSYLLELNRVNHSIVKQEMFTV